MKSFLNQDCLYLILARCFSLSVLTPKYFYSLLSFFSDSQNLDINMRIGVHSGNLFAGVIGEAKLQFDIWGEKAISRDVNSLVTYFYFSNFCRTGRHYCQCSGIHRSGGIRAHQWCNFE